MWSLPIQAIIQAAFFRLIARRPAVACRRFVTRQRLHVHIDVCDRGGGDFYIDLYSKKASSAQSESYLCTRYEKNPNQYKTVRREYTNMTYLILSFYKEGHRASCITDKVKT